MLVRLRHVGVDVHDLPGLARILDQAPGWEVLAGRDREIVIGTKENAAAGLCFLPVTDPETAQEQRAPRPD